MSLKQEDYPVNMTCDVLKLSRSSFYYRAEDNNDKVLKARLLQLAVDWPTYGYRRITHQLRREGMHVNHKVVIRLMRELGLSQPRRRSEKRTTNSKHPYQRFPNLVTELAIIYPDQAWVADITYVRLNRTSVFLAILMAVFTRAIRGWTLGQDLSQMLTLTALERALSKATPTVHHLDQGWQYAAIAYIQRLETLGVTVSMVEVGPAWQNGYAERLIRTIREEAIDLYEYYDYNDAYQRIGRFIYDVYMKKRIHSSLGYLTPVGFEQRLLDGQSEQLVRSQLANNPLLTVLE